MLGIGKNDIFLPATRDGKEHVNLTLQRLIIQIVPDLSPTRLNRVHAEARFAREFTRITAN